MTEHERLNGSPRPCTQGREVRGEAFFFFASTIALALSLAGCQASSAARTRIIEGQYLGVTPHQIQIEIEEPGQLSNQLALPMAQDVQVTQAGQAIPLGKLPTGSPVRLTRDLDSHLVTRIDAK
jgi:hypothetical protein